MAPTNLQYEFPAELDEFLQLCVDHHGEDWEAIAADFLDIAAGLDQDLLARANDFFSPAVLQQRVAELCMHAQRRDPSSAPAQTCSFVREHKEEPRRHASNTPARHSPDLLPAVVPCRPHQSNALSAKVFADMQQHLPSTMDLGDEVNALLDELSDDSGDDDFAEMRRDMKKSSGTMVPTSTVVPPPPPTPVRSATTFQGQKHSALPAGDLPIAVPKQFQEDNQELSDDLSTEAEALDEEDAATIPMQAIQSVLNKLSGDKCSSYNWFNATRLWPALQVKVGSPEFVHSHGELKVVVERGRLLQLLEEERQLYAEICQQRQQRLQYTSEDYIQEAERRRKMVGSLAGGMLLRSPLAA